MLIDAVTLDASMLVPDALRRLAQHGFWRDPTEGEARRWLEEYAERIRKVASRRRVPMAMLATGGDATDARDSSQAAPEDLDAATAASMLARPIERASVVVRRQDGTTIFWYARRMDQVLDDLLRHMSYANATVLDALGLHEFTADPAVQGSELASAPNFAGVVLNGQTPVAVSVAESVVGLRPGGGDRSGGAAPPVPADEEDDGFLSIPKPRAPVAREVRAYPSLAAPDTVVVGVPFDLVIGLADAPRPDVKTSGQLVLEAPAGATVIPLFAHVVAEGFDLDAGGAWHVPLPVSVDAPTRAQVVVRLTPKAQNEDVRLTSLAVHYILDGVARGSAARNIVVERVAGAAPRADDRGTAWKGSEGPPPTLALGGAATAPDMEVDITKPDGNVAKGTYCCVIRNSHGVPVTDAALMIELGEDAHSFAKGMIDNLRLYGSHDIVDNLLENIGDRVARALPQEFWDTLRDVAHHVGGRAVTLQFNSAEPYVPWELALVEPPLDAQRPKYLAAQVVMGRWILGDSAVASPPRNVLDVKAMAVMAGMYNAVDGLRPLPMAVAEAKEIAVTYKAMPAVPLRATLDDLKSLLGASLMRDFDVIGGVEAVHFAGHGEVDPTRPGDAALFLSSGQPLTPLFFGKSKLGDKHRPFIFLNACMVGTGGELLGQFGGFPGACLHGGFTALVAPLWAVKDDVAKSFALDFYKEALVNGRGRAVAEVLRDLRGRYRSDAPIASYLAYVYYGNPFLTLAHTAAPTT